MTYPPQQPNPYNQQPPGFNGPQPGQQFPPGAASGGYPQQQPGSYGQQNPYGAAPAGYPYGQQPGGPSSLPPTRKKKKTGLIIGITAAIIVILIVVGGGFGWPGFFTNKNSSKANAGGSTGGIGNLSNLDLCSFVSPSAVPTNGYGPASFSACVYNLKLQNSSTEVDMYVDDSQTYDFSQLSAQNEATVSAQGQLKIAKKQTTDASSSEYDETIQAPGGVYINFELETEADQNGQTTSIATSTLKSLADNAVNSAVSNINANKIKHLDYSQDYLAQLDACSVFSAADLSSAAQGMNAKPSSSPGKHKCYWGTQNDPVNVQFQTVIYPSTSIPPQGAQTITIAGQTSFAESGTGTSGPYCEISTAGKTYPKWPGAIQSANPSVTEIPIIYVYGTSGSTPDQLCEIGQNLATTAWPKLHLPTS